MYLKFLTVLSILFLTACSITTVPPVEEISKKNEEVIVGREVKPDVVKKQIVTEYSCKNKKQVRVQKSVGSKKAAPITVSFHHASYKLSPQVSRQAKKYSNIRWTWTENMQGVGTLTDNSHKILAEKCVKKASR